MKDETQRRSGGCVLNLSLNLHSPKKIPCRKGEKVPKGKQEDADADKGEENTPADSREANTDRQ